MWRQIPGGYEVSKMGQVRNARTKHVLKPDVQCNGRNRVCIHGKWVHVDELIETAFGLPKRGIKSTIELRVNNIVESEKEQEEIPVFAGQKVKATPAWMLGNTDSDKQRKQAAIKGRVVEIHKRHKWFLLEYELNGCVLREGFKFASVGKDVILNG